MAALSIFHLFFLIFIALCLASIIRYIWLRRQFYHFRGGWLIVRKGFLPEESRYKIAHLKRMKVKRGFLDLITNNGKLCLDFGEDGVVILIGLAPYRELLEIADRIQSLSELLRNHPILKGIAI